MQLVVALDRSDADTAVVAAAAALAQAAQAAVTLLHVATPRSQGGRVAAVGLRDALRDIVAERQRALAGYTVVFGDLPVAVVVETLRFGVDVPRCITRVAADRGADILVVGSRRLATLSGLLRGSVAEGLLAQSPCPLLLVRAQE